MAGGESSAGSSGDDAGASEGGGGAGAGTSGNAGTAGVTAGATPCGGADLKSDPANCGTCGNNCASSPNLAPSATGITCKDGMCMIPDSACATGKKHCSVNAREICETDLTTSARCGACGTKCDVAQICGNGVCADNCPTGATKCTSGQSGVDTIGGNERPEIHANGASATPFPRTCWLRYKPTTRAA